MSKNENITHLDSNQISTREHDVSLDAKRVMIVGGEKFEMNIDSDKISSAIIESLGKEPKIVEKNVFIPQVEIHTIEIPKIIKEIEYKTIEVEKERHYPMLMQICAVVQAIAVIALLVINLIRK